MSFWLDDCNCEFQKKIVNLMIVVGPMESEAKVHSCSRVNCFIVSFEPEVFILIKCFFL
jgi:hypothetical protein